jgi:hypothetical protein
MSTAPSWDDFDNELDREVESWRPENDGDQVRGTVIKLDERDGLYGTTPVVTVATPDDRHVSIFGGRTVLKNKIDEAGLEVGDLFGVRYLGKKESASGATYHDYNVVVRNPDGTPKTSRFGPAASNTSDDDGEPPAATGDWDS